MNSVQSKYKNPDKMITTLQKRIGEITRAWDSALRYQKSIEGNFIMSYGDSAPDELLADGFELFELEIGDTIINIGEVIDVTASKKNNETMIIYKTTETRKR